MFVRIDFLFHNAIIYGADSKTKKKEAEQVIPIRDTHLL
jgi:hypothetical protein